VTAGTVLGRKEDDDVDRFMDAHVAVSAVVDDVILSEVLVGASLSSATSPVFEDEDEEEVEGNCNGGNSMLHILMSVQFPAVAKQYLPVELLSALPELEFLPVDINDNDINAVGKPLLLASSQFHNIWGISTFMIHFSLLASDPPVVSSLVSTATYIRSQKIMKAEWWRWS
jgi:hypothetical protein